MTDSTPDALSKSAARVGTVLVLVGCLLALLLQVLPASLREDSTLLLFVSQALVSIPGFMILISNLKTRVRPIVTAVAGGIMIFFVVCLGLLFSSGDMGLVGEELGVVVSQILFFVISGGVDDLINGITKDKKSAVVMAVWLGNMIAMSTLVMAWTLGHLHAGDTILTAAFVVTYTASTKYCSLIVSTPERAKKVRRMLGGFILLNFLFGWAFVLGLTHPGLMPNGVSNSALFPLAVAFGVSYIVDGLIRGKEEIPLKAFFTVMGLQLFFMIAVALIGAILPAKSPLVMGLLLMESLPNVPGAIALITEVKGQQIGWVRWYNTAISLTLTALMLFSASAIFVQSYGTLAGGITITLLQSVPWMLVAQRACLEWFGKPKRALGILLTMLMAAICLSVGLSYWMTKGTYTETDLTTIWYSFARFPSAICLDMFGLLGVILVGAQAPKAWRYLLLATGLAVGAGFIWSMVALLTNGSVESLIAPSMMMQVAGGVNVTLVYAAFNSTSFREKANAAMATQATSNNL